MCQPEKRHSPPPARQFYPYNKRVIKRSTFQMKDYRLIIEYWVPDEDENLYEERIVRSWSSCGKIADDFLAQDRTNLIRSVEVTPV